jgi:pyruvate/2-oxoacid:ferredoxin oxidoreductase alpha subunit
MDEMIAEPADQTLILTGNEAAAWAARRAKVHVVTAFPITPQTTVMETIAQFVDAGKMNSQFLRMESEHSVMAGMVGASMTGARTFTATSGQGLLYMAELVHWASGARLPVVTTIASRGIAPPWNIWVDYSDVLSMRDTGWMIQFASTHQEIFDSVIINYKVAENPEIMLPAFVAYGGFTQSHTSKPVAVPGQDRIDDFLPPPPRKGWPHLNLDPDRPIVHGNIMMPHQEYMEFRFKIHETMERAKSVIKEAIREFKDGFGRDYHGLIESYLSEDAEYLLVTVGALAEQAKDAVDSLRKQGVRAGLVKLRYYRPFPTEDLVALLEAGNLKAVAVADRSIAYGSPTGGHISSDFYSVLRQTRKEITYLPVVWGLGGRDVTVEEQVGLFEDLRDFHEGGRVGGTNKLVCGTLWVGLR